MTTEEVSSELVERLVVTAIGALSNVLDVLLDVEVGDVSPARGSEERSSFETLAVAGATTWIEFATAGRGARVTAESLLLELLGELGIEIDDVAGTWGRFRPAPRRSCRRSRDRARS